MGNAPCARIADHRAGGRRSRSFRNIRVEDRVIEGRASRHRPARRRSLLAGHAALLGAALASNSADLFEAALDDRLHEPYRAEELSAPRPGSRTATRRRLGATLSGAGPTVIVWAR